MSAPVEMLIAPLTHLNEVSIRPGLHLPSENYDCWAAYVTGYDAALGYDLLRGFREWATILYNQQANLAWSSVVLGLVAGNHHKHLQSASEHRAAIATAFDLIRSFVQERSNDLAANEILARYKAWEIARDASLE